MTSPASISSHDVTAESAGWLGQNVIGGDLGECLAGAAEQLEHAAAGLNAQHRHQRHAPGVRPDQSRELTGYRVIGTGHGHGRTPTGRPGDGAAAGPGQWQAYFVPVGRAGRQFQVPARILPAGAPPQRDAGTDQPQIRGVVIDGAEELLASQ